MWLSMGRPGKRGRAQSIQAAPTHVAGGLSRENHPLSSEVLAAFSRSGKCLIYFRM